MSAVMTSDHVLCTGTGSAYYLNPHPWCSPLGQAGNLSLGVARFGELKQLPLYPAPVKYGVPAAVGAAVLAVPLAAPILGGIYGIGAAGPVAGGVFAGIQAGGAVVAGSSWAVVQSIAMGAALPAIGVVSTGAIGGAVGAACKLEQKISGA
ncbi:hypothetical protein B0H16DRAFT_1448468 [Mycena metata]|uniref:Uncharacterized protein n=1 Tax=Mycena metata TaxID=1033252 RepID=A0AAD7KAC0_9AGAR|nr:hypothetical protein B0H16DRAFT_1448468 [Mycena metata]